MGNTIAYLYHYTDQRGYNAILNSKKILPSGQAADDAAFGDGVYFTSMPPETSTDVLLGNNFDGVRRPKQRVEYYIKIPNTEIPTAGGDASRNKRCVPGPRESCQPQCRGI